jgi:hypothetical protein
VVARLGNPFPKGLQVKIRNYTSEVAPSVTIGRIQAKLLEARVNAINMEYTSNGSVIAITFTVVLNGRPNMVRLDPKIKEVQEALWRQYAAGVQINSRRKGVADFFDQAQRTAWRLLQDWLEIEFSRVALNQGEFEEIFMAHLWDGQQTSYQYLKSVKFSGLLPEKSSANE